MNIAIVTGASSGLGGEFVRLLARDAALDEIWVIARREDRLRALQEGISTPLRALPLDLTEKSSIRELVSRLEEAQPLVRMLVNAAGFGKIGSDEDISLEDCENMIDLNCRAAVAVTHAVLSYMGPGDHIMQICSTAAFQPFQYLSIYAASKSFLYRYSRALRVELLSRRISVTAVCPYWIRDTEFIGTAQKTRNSTYVRRFPLASRQRNVARWAMSDTRLGLAVSTPGPICLIHRIVAKFIPSELMMGLWAILRRL